MHKSQEAEHRNEQKRSFLQFFCFSFSHSLSLSSKHKERAHSHDLFFFLAAGILCISWFYHTARGSFLLSFSSFSSSSLHIPRYLTLGTSIYIVCLPEKYKYRCKVKYVAIRGHPPLLSPGGCSTHPSFHRYMYLSKANMCLPGAKSWIRTRALHSVDGGTRERSYENVF